MIPIFYGEVKNGKLTLEDKEKRDNYLLSLSGRIEVTYKKPQKQRSDAQNKYFHAVIVKMLSDHTGYETEEIKEMLRGLFLSYEIKIGEKIVKVGRSTASLSVSEFEELNSKCRRWASQTEGVELYIPEPNCGIMEY